LGEDLKERPGKSLCVPIEEKRTSADGKQYQKVPQKRSAALPSKDERWTMNNSEKAVTHAGKNSRTPETGAARDNDLRRQLAREKGGAEMIDCKRMNTCLGKDVPAILGPSTNGSASRVFFLTKAQKGRRAHKARLINHEPGWGRGDLPNS